MITPAFLCGGAGTRLWPVSRMDRPKQLHRLTGERSMLADTVRRFAPDQEAGFAPPLIVTGGRYGAAARAACAPLGPARYIIEPAARNTAPAIAAAALVAADDDPAGLVLAAPADHHVERPEALAAAVRAASGAADAGALVTFGVTPDRPETGYGYIHVGEGTGPTRAVAAFVEKPDRPTAESYLRDGSYLWNAGVFLFRADVMIAALERFEPEVLAAARAALAGAARKGDVIALEAAAFAASPSISIDYAVMERAENVAVAPIDVGWNDIGSWEALWRAAGPDDQGVAAQGDVVAIDARDCYVRADGPVVAVSGVRDLAVVATPDAVMVAPLSQSQSVKAIVGALNASGRMVAQISAGGAGRLADRAIRLREWLIEDATPLWAERGVDARGGFYEALTFDGGACARLDRRFRVQARQIFCLAQAAELGWAGPAKALVEANLALWPSWRGAEGGWAHTLTPDLGVRDATLDAYDHAFALLGLAWAHRLTGRADLVGLADETLALLDARLSDGATPGYWDTPAKALPRRQNPHMHLLEACLAWHEATGEARYLDRARGVVELFTDRFLDPARGVVREYFGADWAPAAGAAGEVVEPGHLYEWVWLLSRYERAAGADLTDAIVRLYAFAQAFGVNPDTGLVMDETRRDGVPMRASARCWPQTEAIRAALAMAARGAPGAEARAVAAIDTLLTRYLATSPRGLWVDAFDAEGGAMAENVPASTLYHLAGAAAACVEAAG